MIFDWRSRMAPLATDAILPLTLSTVVVKRVQVRYDVGISQQYSVSACNGVRQSTGTMVR